MRAFGEGFCVYRPPIRYGKSVNPVIDRKPYRQRRGDAELHHAPALEGGHHSTYTDTSMLTRRVGTVRVDQRADATQGGIVDNDWIEAFNANGARRARGRLSQCVSKACA